MENGCKYSVYEGISETAGTKQIIIKDLCFIILAHFNEILFGPVLVYYGEDSGDQLSPNDTYNYY